MSSYSDYLKEIEERKSQDLSPKPIEDGALVSEIIEQIKDTGHEHREQSLQFFIYNTLPGTTGAAGVKAPVPERDHPGPGNGRGNHPDLRLRTVVAHEGRPVGRGASRPRLERRCRRCRAGGRRAEDPGLSVRRGYRPAAGGVQGRQRGSPRTSWRAMPRPSSSPSFPTSTKRLRSLPMSPPKAIFRPT